MNRGTFCLLTFLLVLPLAAILAMKTNAQSDVYALDGALWSKATSLMRVLWLVGYDNGFTSGLRLATEVKSENNKEIPAPQSAGKIASSQLSALRCRTSTDTVKPSDNG